MTRQELDKEIRKIDGYIEILQNFISEPHCKCIADANNMNDTFTEENIKHLQSLINVRSLLLPLQAESDDSLAKLDYIPVQFTCAKEVLLLAQ
jgi:hypothetical protein